jgi:hypothetical protein
MKYGNTIYSVDVFIKVFIVSKFSVYIMHDWGHHLVDVTPQTMLELPPLPHISYCAEIGICQSEKIRNRSCTEKWNMHSMFNDFS